jgi:hypothetical protein
MGAEQSTVSTSEQPGFFAGLLDKLTGKGEQTPVTSETSETSSATTQGGGRRCRRKLTRRSPMRSKSKKRKSLRNK